MVLLGLFDGNIVESTVLKCGAVDFSDKKSIWRTFGECIFFVEATGFEGGIKSLEGFIYKGFRYSFPIVPQNLLFTFRGVIRAY